MRRRDILILAAVFGMVGLGSLSVVLGSYQRALLCALAIAIYACAAAIRLRGWARRAPGESPRRCFRSYRLKPTDAGRWVDAPVAELDKSTFGKLLASRAGRDPGLHVVVRRSPPEVRSDSLYDDELDG